MKKLNLSLLKKINFPLVIGILIVISISIVVINPKAYTDKDPNFRHIMRLYNVVENGEVVQKYEAPPLRPNRDNLLGTDEFGRDSLARLSYGAKTTIYAAFLATILRFLVAIPIGIWAGLGGKIGKNLIKGFSTVFTALPQLVVCFIVFNINYLTTMSVEQSIVAFAIVFTIVGWGKLANLIQEKTVEIYNQVFIEGEIAIGKSKMVIALQNLLPHLIPSLTSYFFLEIGMVLFLMAQLSVLYVFIGPRMLYTDDVRGTFFMAQDPEWASMLSRAVLNFNLGYWWAGMIPAIVFAYSIAGFNLVGEGLRIEFDKRTSRVVSWLRKIPFLISPRIYIIQMMSFKTYYRAVVAKTICYAIVLTLILIPPPRSPHPFIIDNALETLATLASDEFEGRLAGTSGGYKAGDYIVEQLQKYGIEPFFDDGYFQKYPLGKQLYVGSYNNPHKDLTLIGIADGTISFNGRTFKVGKDFSIQRISNNIIIPDNEDLYEALNQTSIEASANLPASRGETVLYKPPTIESDPYYEAFYQPKRIEGAVINYKDVLSGKISLMQDFRDKILFVPGQEELKEFASSYNLSNILGQARTMYIDTIIMESSTELLRASPSSIEDITLIVLSREVSSLIHNSNEPEIAIDFSIKEDEYSEYGRNIVGIIRGSDPINSAGKEQYMIVAASYDGIPGYNNYRYDLASSTAATATGLEIARILGSLEEKPKYNILFVFWDGEHSVLGSRYYKYNSFLKAGIESVFYIDIGNIGGDSTIYYMTESPKIYGERSFEFMEFFKKRLKELKISTKTGMYTSQRYYDLLNRNTFNIGFSSIDWKNVNTISDTVENLNKDSIQKLGQVIVDTLYWYCYRNK